MCVIKSVRATPCSRQNYRGKCACSELSVRTSTEMNGRTVRCVSNSNSGMLTVGDAFISSKFLDAHACTCVCICVYAHALAPVENDVCPGMGHGKQMILQMLT